MLFFDWHSLGEEKFTRVDQVDILGTITLIVYDLIANKTLFMQVFLQLVELLDRPVGKHR